MTEADDLDAFFDEVSEVEAIAVEQHATSEGKAGDGQVTEALGGNDCQIEPPAKRSKTSTAERPRGVVVASATSVLTCPERKEKEDMSPSFHQSPGVHLPRLSNPAAGSRQTSAPIGPPFSGANHPSDNNDPQDKKKAPKTKVRLAAGQAWVDESLDEWPENDFRIFVGNLSNEVSDAQLFQHFQKYPSLAKAKVIRFNDNPEKSKGYGFVSLLDPLECARALREMDQTWLSSRPIRIKRSDWKDRDFSTVKKREKKEKKKQKRTGLRI